MSCCGFCSGGFGEHDGHADDIVGLRWLIVRRRSYSADHAEACSALQQVHGQVGPG